MMKEKIMGEIMVLLMAFICITVYGNEISLMGNSDVNGVYDFRKAIGITWKLYGFGTMGEDEVKKAKPEKGDEWWKEEQYTLLFKEDGTLKGHTFSNDFFGKYNIDGNNLVIGDLCATEVGEVYDGDKYYKALYSPITHVFEIKDDQLLLYYNEGQNYLLFCNGALDLTNIQNNTPTRREESSGIFDLQGRPVKNAAKRGIYVKDGRKVIK